MQHIINVAFDFDDKRVTKMLEENAQEQIFDKIEDEIREFLFTRQGYTGDKPIKAYTTKAIERIVDTHKEEIIELAADRLADKLSRTKAVKEKVKEVIDNA